MRVYEILKSYNIGIDSLNDYLEFAGLDKVNVNSRLDEIDYKFICKLLNSSHISKYDSDKFTNHEEKRERKLLLNKKEILKINQKTMSPGYTIIPLKIYVYRGLIKIQIGICKGKHNYDKRNDIKDRDNKRELNRIMKSY